MPSKKPVATSAKVPELTPAMKQFATLMLNPELFDIDAKAYTKAGLAQVGTKFKALLKTDKAEAVNELVLMAYYLGTKKHLGATKQLLGLAADVGFVIPLAGSKPAKKSAAKWSSPK